MTEREYDYQMMLQVCSDLEEYLDLTSDERQEALDAVIQMIQKPDHISPDLWNLGCKELIDALNWYREFTEIQTYEIRNVTTAKQLVIKE